MSEERERLLAALEAVLERLDRHLQLDPNDTMAWSLWVRIRSYLGRPGAEPDANEPR